MARVREDSERVRRAVGDELITLTAAKDTAEAGPCVRSEARTMDRITQRECSEDRTDGALVQCALTQEHRHGRIFEDVEAAFLRVEHEPFNADSEVAGEEIFDVAASAPGVIVADVVVERAENWTAFARALCDVDEPEVGIVIGVGEDVRAPEVHVEFVVAIEFIAAGGLGDLFAGRSATERRRQDRHRQDRQCGKEKSFHIC